MRKIGDIVQIRKDLSETLDVPGVVEDMTIFKGNHAAITGYSESIDWPAGYQLDIDGGLYLWTEELLEPEPKVEAGLVVKIHKLSGYAEIPQYQTAGASGFDLVCIEYTEIAPGKSEWIPLGLAFEIPQGYEMQIRPRSGLSQVWPGYISNSPGTIDSDYRGEVLLGIINQTHHTMYLNPGDRIAQGVICPVVQAKLVETTELTETERGEGGFGSTGKD